MYDRLERKVHLLFLSLFVLLCSLSHTPHFDRWFQLILRSHYGFILFVISSILHLFLCSSSTCDFFYWPLSHCSQAHQNPSVMSNQILLLRISLTSFQFQGLIYSHLFSFDTLLYVGFLQYYYHNYHKVYFKRFFLNKIYDFQIIKIQLESWQKYIFY